MTKFIKIIKWVLLLYIIYMIAGALLPFVHMKKTGEDFQQSFDPQSFYSESVGPDRARVVETSMDALESRITMIHQARERIVLSTFDIREGQSSRDIFSSLIEAANRDVKVQILVDGLYGFIHMSGNPVFYAAGTHPNIEIRYYNTPHLLKPWTFNGRLHDKYLMVDDKLLLLGGRNTFDYFLGEYNLKSLSYDRDVLIYNTAFGNEEMYENSVIYQADEYFEDIWDSKYCKTVFHKPSSSMNKKITKALLQLEEHYAALASSNPELTASDRDYKQETTAINKATLIYNPTHIYSKEPWVWYQIQYLMEHASERNYIHTPYAVPSKDMYDGLAAVVAKVPDTTMLLNSTSVGDNFMASSDYTLNRPKILNTGVKLYEYFGDRSSHGKSILIDHRLALVGSYNLDMRSTYLDTETMLVIDGEEFNSQLENCIDDLASDSLLVSPDGTYENNPAVCVIPVSDSKKLIFAFTSLLFQLFRYLI